MKNRAMMNDDQLNIFMHKHLSRLNHYLDDYLDQLDSYPALRAAMRYSVDAGGKRLRPLLILTIIKSLKGEISDSDYQVAAALELVHTYSLIHDDLPEMDNDDLRRGKPTNHKVYGQAMAVLAGDGLLTTAFEWISALPLDAAIIVKLVNKLANAAGPQGMVHGQVGDIMGEQRHLTLDELIKVHHEKTGALLCYAGYAGGILGNANDFQLEKLVNFGKVFGLAFQIYDDLLDVIGSEQQLGKKVRKDQAEHKNTYPGLLGVAGTKKALKQKLSQMDAILCELKNNKMNINLLSGFLEYFKF